MYSQSSGFKYIYIKYIYIIYIIYMCIERERDIDMLIYIYIYMYVYIYIYTYICIYKFTSECHSQASPSSEWDSQGQKTYLAPHADKQIRNYDIECSNHHPSLSTLRPKGLSHSKMKWLAIYIQITSECHSQTTPSSEWR